MTRLRTKVSSVVWGCTWLILLFIVVSNSVACRHPPPPHIPPPREPAARVFEHFPEQRPIIKNARNQVADAFPETLPRSGGSLDSTEVQLIEDLENASTPTSARNAMEEFADRGGYEWLFIQALCSGMNTLSEYQDSQYQSAADIFFSEEAWTDFFLDYFQAVGPRVITGYRGQDARQMIEDITTTWDLAQESPITAAVYVNACVMS